jgi:DnaJ-class molecular chaperone
MIRPQRIYAPETCARCAGTGKKAVSLSYIVSCLVCGGKGTVSVPQPAGACPQCEGSGKRSVTGSCLTCAGSGWSHVFA